MYQPTRPPEDTPLTRWLQGELTRIAQELQSDTPALRLTALHAAPSRIYEDMLVRADGTDWNPGAGAGLYARVAGVWTKL